MNLTRQLIEIARKQGKTPDDIAPMLAMSRLIAERRWTPERISLYGQVGSSDGPVFTTEFRLFSNMLWASIQSELRRGGIEDQFHDKVIRGAIEASKVHGPLTLEEIEDLLQGKDVGPLFIAMMLMSAGMNCGAYPEQTECFILGQDELKDHIRTLFEEDPEP